MKYAIKATRKAIVNDLLRIKMFDTEQELVKYFKHGLYLDIKEATELDNDRLGFLSYLIGMNLSLDVLCKKKFLDEQIISFRKPKPRDYWAERRAIRNLKGVPNNYTLYTVGKDEEGNGVFKTYGGWSKFFKKLRKENLLTEEELQFKM